MKVAPAAEVSPPKSDLVTFEVMKNSFINVTEEMALTVRRAAYSTNIKTRADFSCAFFDAKLRCIAQSFAQPPHLVSMATIVPNAVTEFGIERLEAGDVLLVNDPHRGSSHLNDIACISPIFVEGKLAGFAGNMAHHVDVGGSSPASLAVSRELFQEGIILPPTRIAREGQIDHNVFDLILENLRAPRETNGDLRAQIAANFVGANRVQDIFRRFSATTVESFFDELIDYTENWVDNELRKLPQGVYEVVGYRDDDGFTEEPVKLALRVEIKDGFIILDPTGSSEQRPSPLNCTRAMATCCLAFVTRCLLSDGVPINSGFLKRIRTTGPDGLVCTAMRPAAVVGGWELGQRIAELLWLALHPALPDRVPASGKGLIVNLGFGGQDPKRGEYYCYMETIAGGNGGRPTKDGPDAVQTTLHNTENAPVEEVELYYPIRIGRYELIEDSCGAGRYRGGLGVRRDFEFPYAACTFTVLSDGRKFAPWGLDGGLEGRPAHYIFDPHGEARELPSKATVEVPKGGCVRVETPGGGGFGNPLQRNREAVAVDRRDGKISATSARDIYGLRGIERSEGPDPSRPS